MYGLANIKKNQMEIELKSQEQRIQSIDVLRGVVMILMAIDHVRVYSGVPAGGPEFGVFFTRWVTHFCAPVFTFLAGASAYLYYDKIRSASKTSFFLVTRGLLLVVLELTVVRFCWTFNLNYDGYILAGVIWMLGWCMMILSAFVKLNPKYLLGIGLFIIFFQDLFAFLPDLFPQQIQEFMSQLWQFFYPTSSRNNSLSGKSGLISSFGISILYVLIPWIGVMICGFVFGSSLRRGKEYFLLTAKRTGVIATIAFIIIAVFFAVSDDAPGPIVYKVLGQRKYPASQLYLLMTLGPALLLISWAENRTGFIWSKIKAVGRVPMFFYLLHIPLIHLSALAVNILRDGVLHQDWYETAPLVGVAKDEQWPLYLLYIVWVLDTLILVKACEWYSKYKRENPQKALLKYI